MARNSTPDKCYNSTTVLVSLTDTLDFFSFFLGGGGDSRIGVNVLFLLTNTQIKINYISKMILYRAIIQKCMGIFCYLF